MTKRRGIIIPAIVLGLLLVAVAIVYWVEPAKSLPSFFPGQDKGSTQHHVKHGIAAVALGIGCFVLAWFQSGPARSETGRVAHDEP